MQVIAGEIAQRGGSVWIFEGIDPVTQDVVWFGVDHRPARDLEQLLIEQGEVPCEVEEWQLIRRAAVVPDDYDPSTAHGHDGYDPDDPYDRFHR